MEWITRAWQTLLEALFEGREQLTDQQAELVGTWQFQAFSLAVVAATALLAYLLARWIIGRIVHRAIGKSRTKWDDSLQKFSFFRRFSLIVPAVIFYSAAEPVLGANAGWLESTCYVFLIASAVLIVDSFFKAVLDIYNRYDVSRRVPIRGFLQVAKLIIVIVAIILVISVLIGRNPALLFTGLGAMTAVLLFIFKDAILGFVAGLHLTTNQMLHIGDWIEMPKYGADGDVIDISLSSVKVRNWDKTITSIPTYALISDSFKNWRGMQESGGRRIARAIQIDMNTVRFCNREMLERFKRIQYIRGYLDAKEAEIAEHNARCNVSEDDLLNGRHLTNLGTFRAYLVAWLKNHPKIRQDLTFLIRQLAPTESGLPMQIYVFTDTTVWAEYEGIQADIFDHVLAILPEFDLRVYQAPAGTDFRQLTGRLTQP
ncbi:MAG: mechanosensitive ion channel family protein [Phycisphaerae bacterium]